MKAPFPYFGGKSSVADMVWSALGSPRHYIEPFFGSGAVLLNRPKYSQDMCETVCDKDGFICNVWRSIQFAPDEVAQWCDWPVNHVDLNARRKELLKNEERLVQNLTDNTEWFDAKQAGYWIWAASCWIGSGLTNPSAIQHISDAGKGVHALGKRPHIGHAGKGVHAGKAQNIYDWLNELSFRLRRVRVVCGDWTRVCGGDWQNKMGSVGIFFDPPYGVEDRDTDIYHHDSMTVAADVMEWCKERGKKEDYRIVLAGYEEYADLVNNYGWKSESWKANGGYANTGDGQGKENCKREMLYFSPHCVGCEKTLF